MANTYPRSSILFYETKLKPSANFYVDSLSTYLSELPANKKLNIEAQYIKHDLTITLKLNMPESYQTNFDYNYVAITNYKNSEEVEGTIYYFIDSVKPVSQNTIEFVLKMDSINSLGYGESNPANPRNFTKKTFIQREHKDRFVKKAAYVPDPEHPETELHFLINKVDKEPENLQTTKVKKTDIALNDVSNLDWYLVYDGKPDTTEWNPITVNLCAEDRIKVDKATNGQAVQWNPTDFGTSSDQYYGTKTRYLLQTDNSTGVSITLGSPTAHTTQACDYTGSIANYNIGDTVQSGYITINGTTYRTLHTIKNIGFYKYAENKIIMTVKYDTTTSEVAGLGEPNFAYKPSEVECSYVSITYSSAYREINFSDTENPVINPGSATQWTFAENYGVFHQLTIGSHTYEYIRAFKDIDRTKESLSKIIKLPYCPINYTYNSTTQLYHFDYDLWAPTDGLLQYTQKYTPDLLRNQLMNVDLTNVLTIPLIDSEPDLEDLYDIKYETKLRSSEFSTFKFAYDNAVFQLKPENINFASDYVFNFCPLHVKYKVSSALTSKFLFEFDFSDIADYDTIEDYERFMFVNRNNEETIYNSQYLNYINNGYNFDKKQLSLQSESEWRQATWKAASMIPSALSTIINPRAGFGLASNTINFAGSLDALTTSQELRQISFDKNIAELRAQGTTISGTDDLQLLSYYNGNRLRYLNYTTVDAQKEEIGRIFHLFGYNCNKHLVPNVDSRCWFNYLKCIPVLSTENIDNIKPAWLDDMKAKYNEGVIVLHCNKINNGTADVNTWDFEQKYENWETWLVEETTNE